MKRKLNPFILVALARLSYLGSVSNHWNYYCQMMKRFVDSIDLFSL